MTKVVSYYKEGKHKTKRFPFNTEGKVKAIKYWQRQRRRGIKCYITYKK